MTLSEAFWLSETEVTQEQWEALMAFNPSHGGPNGAGTPCGAGCPVETVNWYDTLEFANAFSAAEGLPACYALSGCTGTPGDGCAASWCPTDTYSCATVEVNTPSGSVYDCTGYRLPTEAEWEYGARAGTDLRYAGSDTVDDVAWYLGNSPTSQPVATWQPNGWGLYDMSGNVWELTWDRYASDHYSLGPATDPTGPTSGDTRATRGGSANYPAADQRVASRLELADAARGSNIGFRLARSVPATTDDDGDGFSESAGDCDDTDLTAYPDAPESCDSIDSDCDGSLADEFDDLDGDDEPDCVDEDADGDGFDSTVDCDDLDATSTVVADDPDCDGLFEDMTVQDISLVLLAAGTFEMGCTANQTGCTPSESPVHEVTLTNDFWLGETEVTQEQWETLMGNNPSSFGPSGNGPACGLSCPVDSVNWFDALAFSNAVSAAEGLPECYALSGCTNAAGDDLECTEAALAGPGSAYDCTGYRLPTEAEWEYAARAGTDLRYAGSDIVTDVAWCTDNGSTTTQAVGLLDANGWGLVDMSGNVWEWNWDWWSEAYPSSDPVDDPVGAETGGWRILRGGSWSNGGSSARVSRRGSATAGTDNNYFGFRLARTVP